MAEFYVAVTTGTVALFCFAYFYNSLINFGNSTLLFDIVII